MNGHVKAFLQTFPSTTKEVIIGAVFLLSSGASLWGAESPTSKLARTLNSSLLQLHQAIQKAGASEAPALRVQAAILIERRSVTMAKLIRESPGEALSMAFSPELLAELRSTFPDSAASLEVQGTWEGPSQAWVQDNRDGSHSSYVQLESNGHVLRTYFGDAQPQLKCGDSMRVSGVLAGSDLAALSTSATVIPAPTVTSGSTTGCITTGPQKTVVLMVTFPGVTPPSSTTAQSVQNAFFGGTGYSLDNYWREASYGQTSASGDVFGWYTLSTSYSCATTDSMRAEAITLAANAGVNFQNYTRLFMVVPDMGCGWAGAATILCGSLTSPTGAFTASTSYIDWLEWGAGANAAVTTIMHEGGHNLGLNHSRSRAFGTVALGSLGTEGTYQEYGDGFTAMSNGGPGHYDAPHKAELLGWLTTGNYQTVQSGGTWTLAPLETPASGLQALKIQRGTGNNSWLWVEYRQPTGIYDGAYATGNVWANQVFTGAVVHYEDSFTTNSYSDLLDFTPTSAYGFYDPALAAGQTWADPYSNVSITVNSATATGLNLSVSYGTTPCNHANPTVTMSPANPSVAPGANVGYAVSVVNNDSSGCAADTFTLASVLPGGWIGTFSQTSLTISPGQSASATLTVTVPASALPATYSLSSSATSGSYTGSTAVNATVAVSSPVLTDTESIPAASYSLRQTVPVTAMVMSGATPAAGATVTFTLTKANGSKVTGSATVDSTGKAAWSYKLSTKDPAGSYSVDNVAVYNSKTVVSTPVGFTVP